MHQATHLTCRRKSLDRRLRSVALWCLIILAVLLHTAPLNADGGAVQLSEVKGPYRITVFTSPTPLRSGPIDISVLVQDAFTGAVVPDAEVTIKVNPLDRPTEQLAESANRANATNKILLASTFDLPTSGSWDVRLNVHGSLGTEEVRCRIELSEPWPEWLGMLPWILWPLIPIGFFFVHIVLVHRRRVDGQQADSWIVL
jgi:hypothetical protein